MGLLDFLIEISGHLRRVQNEHLTFGQLEK